MKAEEFKNESGLDFKDISNEEYRNYYWEENMLEIRLPMWLHVSKSGGHRIIGIDGVSYYILPNWSYIEWKAKEGTPHFKII